MNYETADQSKVTNLCPLINSGAAALLENDWLVTQLISLERRASRGGRDSIDAPGGDVFEC